MISAKDDKWLQERTIKEASTLLGRVTAIQQQVLNLKSKDRETLVKLRSALDNAEMDIWGLTENINQYIELQFN